MEIITVYSTQNCPRCDDIKKRLTNSKITFEVNQDISKMKNMGIKTVPMIMIDNILRTYDETLQLLNEGFLSKYILKENVDGRRLMADAKYYEGYSRYMDSVDQGRYEMWYESVRRVMNMHKKTFKNELKENEELRFLFEEVREAYEKKLILGAQRALQFGGEQLLKNPSRLYNCAGSHCDRPNFFGGLFYLLLCGCGAGFSVQKHHVAKLPKVQKRNKSAKTFVIPDSIEGWSEAIDALMSSYFEKDGVYPEYQGRKIYFDLSKIRPKGAKISGGFKAPGAEPLRKCLDLIEQLIESQLNQDLNELKPIVIYDICMHLADAVLSGGIRRAATICVFSKDDDEMMTAKTGDWFIDNPQRSRSNNSVLLLRDETTLEEFESIMNNVKDYGEPGFIWSNNTEQIYNPCCEISMLPISESGESGWQKCNLVEINGAKSITKEVFFEQCKYASILGTLQAKYTDFKFLKDATKKIVEKEALIGVGITGMMNNPHILFDEDIQKEGARIVKYWNKKIAEIIGINQAARTTTIKPSGNSSVLLESASGIHGEHSPVYLRHVQFNKDTEVAKLFIKYNPEMCEDSVWNRERDIVVAFPIKSPANSIYKKDLLGIKQLEYVKTTQQNWIEEGTNVELCTDSRLRHNVSNTITVDNWDEVTKYIYNNRNYLCGISLLSASGDKAYPQAPFTEVVNYEDIVTKYGEVSLFTSALIEAGLNAFENDLWRACTIALSNGDGLSEGSVDLLKRDFVRRFNKFSTNFKSKEECAECLKEIHVLHKYWKITNSIRDIDWINDLSKKEYIDIDTMGAIACHGGKCEI